MPPFIFNNNTCDILSIETLQSLVSTCTPPDTKYIRNSLSVIQQEIVPILLSSTDYYATNSTTSCLLCSKLLWNFSVVVKQYSAVEKEKFSTQYFKNGTIFHTFKKIIKLDINLLDNILCVEHILDTFYNCYEPHLIENAQSLYESLLQWLQSATGSELHANPIITCNLREKKSSVSRKAVHILYIICSGSITRNTTLVDTQIESLLEFMLSCTSWIKNEVLIIEEGLFTVLKTVTLYSTLERNNFRHASKVGMLIKHYNNNKKITKIANDILAVVLQHEMIAKSLETVGLFNTECHGFTQGLEELLVLCYSNIAAIIIMDLNGIEILNKCLSNYVCIQTYFTLSETTETVKKIVLILGMLCQHSDSITSSTSTISIQTIELLINKILDMDYTQQNKIPTDVIAACCHAYTLFAVHEQYTRYLLRSSGLARIIQSLTSKQPNSSLIATECINLFRILTDISVSRSILTDNDIVFLLASTATCGHLVLHDTKSLSNCFFIFNQLSSLITHCAIAESTGMLSLIVVAIKQFSNNSRIGAIGVEILECLSRTDNAMEFLQNGDVSDALFSILTFMWPNVCIRALAIKALTFSIATKSDIQRAIATISKGVGANFTTEFRSALVALKTLINIDHLDSSCASLDVGRHLISCFTNLIEKTNGSASYDEVIQLIFDSLTLIGLKEKGCLMANTIVHSLLSIVVENNIQLQMKNTNLPLAQVNNKVKLICSVLKTVATILMSGKVEDVSDLKKFVELLGKFLCHYTVFHIIQLQVLHVLICICHCGKEPILDFLYLNGTIAAVIQYLRGSIHQEDVQIQGLKLFIAYLSVKCSSSKSVDLLKKVGIEDYIDALTQAHPTAPLLNAELAKLKITLAPAHAATEKQMKEMIHTLISATKKNNITKAIEALTNIAEVTCSPQAIETIVRYNGVTAISSAVTHFLIEKPGRKKKTITDIQKLCATSVSCFFHIQRVKGGSDALGHCTGIQQYSALLSGFLEMDLQLNQSQAIAGLPKLFRFLQMLMTTDASFAGTAYRKGLASKIYSAVETYSDSYEIICEAFCTLSQFRVQDLARVKEFNILFERIVQMFGAPTLDEIDRKLASLCAVAKFLMVKDYLNGNNVLRSQTFEAFIEQLVIDYRVIDILQKSIILHRDGRSMKDEIFVQTAENCIFHLSEFRNLQKHCGLKNIDFSSKWSKSIRLNKNDTEAGQISMKLLHFPNQMIKRHEHDDKFLIPHQQDFLQSSDTQTIQLINEKSNNSESDKYEQIKIIIESIIKLMHIDKTQPNTWVLTVDFITHLQQLTDTLNSVIEVDVNICNITHLPIKKCSTILLSFIQNYYKNIISVIPTHFDFFISIATTLQQFGNWNYLLQSNVTLSFNIRVIIMDIFSKLLTSSERFEQTHMCLIQMYKLLIICFTQDSVLLPFLNQLDQLVLQNLVQISFQLIVERHTLSTELINHIIKCLYCIFLLTSENNILFSTDTEFEKIIFKALDVLVSIISDEDHLVQITAILSKFVHSVSPLFVAQLIKQPFIKTIQSQANNSLTKQTSWMQLNTELLKIVSQQPVADSNIISSFKKQIHNNNQLSPQLNPCLTSMDIKHPMSHYTYRSLSTELIHINRNSPFSKQTHKSLYSSHCLRRSMSTIENHYFQSLETETNQVIRRSQSLTDVLIFKDIIQPDIYSDTNNKFILQQQTTLYDSLNNVTTSNLLNSIMDDRLTFLLHRFHNVPITLPSEKTKYICSSVHFLKEFLSNESVHISLKHNAITNLIHIACDPMISNEHLTMNEAVSRLIPLLTLLTTSSHLGVEIQTSIRTVYLPKIMDAYNIYIQEHKDAYTPFHKLLKTMYFPDKNQLLYDYLFNYNKHNDNTAIQYIPSCDHDQIQFGNSSLTTITSHSILKPIADSCMIPTLKYILNLWTNLSTVPFFYPLHSVLDYIDFVFDKIDEYSNIIHQDPNTERATELMAGYQCLQWLHRAQCYETLCMSHHENDILFKSLRIQMLNEETMCFRIIETILDRLFISHTIAKIWVETSNEHITTILMDNIKCCRLNTQLSIKTKESLLLLLLNILEQFSPWISLNPQDINSTRFKFSCVQNQAIVIEELLWLWKEWEKKTYSNRLLYSICRVARRVYKENGAFLLIEMGISEKLVHILFSAKKLIVSPIRLKESNSNIGWGILRDILCLIGRMGKNRIFQDSFHSLQAVKITLNFLKLTLKYTCFLERQNLNQSKKIENNIQRTNINKHTIILRFIKNCQINACLALATLNIEHEGNVSEFQRHNGIQLNITIMQQAMIGGIIEEIDFNLANGASALMCNTSYRRADIQKLYGSSGGCEAVMKTMKQCCHFIVENNSISANRCFISMLEAIANLALCPSNMPLFIREKIGSMFLSLYDHRATLNGTLLNVSLRTLSNLAIDVSNSPIDSLLTVFTEVLKILQTSNINDTISITSAFNVLGSFCYIPETANIFQQMGGIETVLLYLQQLPFDVEMTNRGLKLLLRVGEIYPNFVVIMVQHGLFIVVRSLFSNCGTPRYIILKSLRLLRTAITFEMSAELFKQCGGIKSLMSLLWNQSSKKNNISIIRHEEEIDISPLKCNSNVTIVTYICCILNYLIISASHVHQNTTILKYNVKTLHIPLTSEQPKECKQKCASKTKFEIEQSFSRDSEPLKADNEGRSLFSENLFIQKKIGDELLMTKAENQIEYENLVIKFTHFWDPFGITLQEISKFTIGIIEILLGVLAERFHDFSLKPSCVTSTIKKNTSMFRIISRPIQYNATIIEPDFLLATCSFIAFICNHGIPECITDIINANVVKLLKLLLLYINLGSVPLQGTIDLASYICNIITCLCVANHYFWQFIICNETSGLANLIRKTVDVLDAFHIDSTKSISHERLPYSTKIKIAAEMCMRTYTLLKEGSIKNFQDSAYSGVLPDFYPLMLPKNNDVKYPDGLQSIPSKKKKELRSGGDAQVMLLCFDGKRIDLHEFKKIFPSNVSCQLSGIHWCASDDMRRFEWRVAKTSFFTNSREITSLYAIIPGISSSSFIPPVALDWLATKHVRPSSCCSLTFRCTGTAPDSQLLLIFSSTNSCFQFINNIHEWLVAGNSGMD